MDDSEAFNIRLSKILRSVETELSTPSSDEDPMATVYASYGHDCARERYWEAAEDDECGEYEGMSFEDSMMLKHPVIDYGYPDLGW